MDTIDGIKVYCIKDLKAWNGPNEYIVLSLENYIQDGILDIYQAVDDLYTLKKIEPYKRVYIDGLGGNVVSKITGNHQRLHNSVDGIKLLDNKIIDNWKIVPILFWSKIKDKYRKKSSIWHIHNKSELVCATTRVDKNEWLCGTCCEIVPSGILFIAKTERLRKAL